MTERLSEWVQFNHESFKSREFSSAGSRRGCQRDAEHEKDLMHCRQLNWVWNLASGSWEQPSAESQQENGELSPIHLQGTILPTT